MKRFGWGFRSEQRSEGHDSALVIGLTNVRNKLKADVFVPRRRPGFRSPTGLSFSPLSFGLRRLGPGLRRGAEVSRRDHRFLAV